MKSISTRFLFSTVSISISILFAIIFINYIFIKDQLLEDANSKAKFEIIKNQNKIEKILFQAIKTSNKAKNLLQKYNLEQKNITSVVTNALEKSPNIYGMAVAMEPGVAYKKQFCPYYYKKNRHLIYVNLASDSYNYLIWPWYKDVRNSTEAKWSEPYFDKNGGDALMATYSNPIFSDSKFAGVITIDLTLGKLKKIITSMHILDTGYAFLLSKKKKVLVYPDESLLMKKYSTDKILYNHTSLHK